MDISMRLSTLRLLGAALSLLVVTTQATWAQEARATMSGRVVDAQSAVVPSALVAIRSEDTGVEQTPRTNEQGNWIVRFLIPGNYSLRVTAPGFKQVEHHGIALQTADQKQFDTQLEVGSTSTQIEVKAETPLIDTTAATSGTVSGKRSPKCRRCRASRQYWRHFRRASYNRTKTRTSPTCGHTTLPPRSA